MGAFSLIVVINLLNRDNVYNKGNKVLYFTYVPISPTWNPALEPKTEVQLSDDKIKLLEKLSLIEVKTPEERQRLNDAVTMATRLSFVDVEGVEPMYMLPNSSQTLRKDIVENLISSEDIKKLLRKQLMDFMYQ